jgi:hypothetical protein
MLYHVAPKSIVKYPFQKRGHLTTERLLLQDVQPSVGTLCCRNLTQHHYYCIVWRENEKCSPVPKYGSVLGVRGRIILKWLASVPYKRQHVLPKRRYLLLDFAEDCNENTTVRPRI